MPHLILVFRLQNTLCEFTARTHFSIGYFVQKEIQFERASFKDF